MARMTVAEKRRLEREATEQAEALEWTNLRAEYNRRLFKLFAQAKEFNVSLTFTEDSVSFDLNKYRDFVLPSVLSETRDQNVLGVLLNLEHEFQELQNARDEENRRYALKKAALAKLNVEERELLGLMGL